MWALVLGKWRGARAKPREFLYHAFFDAKPDAAFDGAVRIAVDPGENPVGCLLPEDEAALGKVAVAAAHLLVDSAGKGRECHGGLLCGWPRSSPN